MKIKQVLLVAIFLMHRIAAIAAEPVVADVERSNATENRLRYNATSVTLPAAALNKNDDESIFPNLAEDKGEEGDDLNKPRPFFMGENLLGLASGLSWIEELLVNLERAADRLMTRTEVRQQQERLEALEKTLAEYRRQQKVEAFNQLHGIQAEETILFRRYPGYQEDHPAHPRGSQVYTVPGILGAGGGGEKKNSVPGSAGGGKAHASRNNAGGSAGVSSGAEGGATGFGSGSGGGGNVPKGAKDKSGLARRIDLHHVEKTLDDGTELEAWVSSSLHCPVCLGLIDKHAAQCIGCSHRDSGKCDKSCTGCELVWCLEHTDLLECCPFCKHKLVNEPGKATCASVLKGKELRNVLWNCVQCNSMGTEKEMEGHISLCPKRHMVQCRHAGCFEQVSAVDLERHEASCEYRPVLFGGHQIAHWEKALIESVQLPENVGRRDVGGTDDALIAVTILKNLVFSLPSTERQTIECLWGCGYLGVVGEDLNSHYSNGCPYALETCGFCNESHKRKDIHSHREACDFRWVDCPQSCGAEQLIAKELDKHALVCDMRLMLCRYCELMVPRRFLGDHEEKCPLRPSSCQGCFAKMAQGALPEHALHCMFMRSILNLGTKALARQSGAKGIAVYESTLDEVYIALPAWVITDFLNPEKRANNPLFGNEELRLTWNECPYKVSFGFRLRVRFFLRLEPLLARYTAVPAAISVLSADGGWIVDMPIYSHPRITRILINHPSNEGEAALYDTADLEGYKGDYLFIRIHKVTL